MIAYRFAFLCQRFGVDAERAVMLAAFVCGGGLD